MEGRKRPDMAVCGEQGGGGGEQRTGGKGQPL